MTTVDNIPHMLFERGIANGDIKLATDFDGYCVSRAAMDRLCRHLLELEDRLSELEVREVKIKWPR